MKNGCNRRRSAQRLDRDEATHHFPKPALHQNKLLVIVWWSATGSSSSQLRESGQNYYCEIQILENTKNYIIAYTQHRWIGKRPILFHDDVQLHVAQLTLQKLNEQSYKVVPHSPYSSDLLPIHNPFFKHLDNFLRETKVMLKQPPFIALRTSEMYATV